jgi:hypothetical protein
VRAPLPHGVLHEEYLDDCPAGKVALLCFVQRRGMLVGQHRRQEGLDTLVLEPAHPGVIALLADHVLQRHSQMLQSRDRPGRLGPDDDLGSRVERSANPFGDDILVAARSP